MTPRDLDRPILTLILLTGLLIAIAAAAGCCYPAPTAPGEPRGLLEQESHAVKLLVVCDEGIYGGSAVVVDTDAALTAAHVIECNRGGKPNAILAEYKDGSGSPAIVVGVAPLADVALLRLPLRPESLVLTAGPVKIGTLPGVEDRVCLVTAHPHRTRRCGEVTGFDSLPGDVRHNVITEPGNSGSGVYDRDGRLVGVVTHLSRCSNGQFCGGMFSSMADRAWMVQR